MVPLTGPPTLGEPARPLPVRLVLVAPRTGSSGPAYYVDQLLQAVRPRVAEVVQLRHGPAGEETWRSVRDLRRRVADVVSTPSPHRTVLHAELSGGSIAGFWCLADHPEVTRTATVHDPPRPVWYPFRTAFVGRHRVLQAAVHRVPERAVRRLERSRLAGTGAVVLSPLGAAATRDLGLLDEVREGRLLVPPAPPTPPPTARPSAVGLFGHLYKGKGFELLAELRAAMDPAVAIRVAGRGTEQLPSMPGVEILGEVADPALDDFFASVRLVLLPYTRTSLGGVAPLPASLTHLTALAHDTPVLALPTDQMSALAATGGVRVLPDVAALAAEASRIAGDPAALEELLAQARTHLAGYDVERSVAPYLDLWSRA